VIRSPAPEVHLDTSFLIRALVPGSDEARSLSVWLVGGRKVALSTLAWGEFLCGPLPEGAEVVARRIARRHVPLGTEQATEAARLFNATGRRRGSFQDCVVAATALVAGAELATSERTDFRRFEAEGPEMAE
jgi:predicted nucleic acid-binding protein